jgi:hypothetical protein
MFSGNGKSSQCPSLYWRNAHKSMDKGLEEDATTKFVLGTRAYSADICSHVNIGTWHAIALSYTNLGDSMDLRPLKKIARSAPFEIILTVIAVNWRVSAWARDAVILDLKRCSRIIPHSLDKIVRHDI